jgi:DNA-binding winged helix-turn-helix (wHTH) protein/tetratricopeptide (TPR) repeat protein
VARQETYTFGGFTLDVQERRLSRHAEHLALAPKAFDLLVTLVRRAGRLISKPELLESVWPESFVEEGILTVHVSALRKLLGDTSRTPRFIETVSGSGYRFIAPVGKQTQAAQVIPERWSIAVLPPRPLSGELAGEPRIGRVDVYELCGRGRAHLLSGSRGEVPKAVDAFRAAVELDSSYAPAYAGLALAHCAQAAMRLAPPLDAYRDARGAALRALAIENRSADAQVALGSVMFLAEWDWSGAERCLRRAIEIDPGHVQASLMYGRLLDALGRADEALEMKLRAFERDPISPLVHVQIAQCCWNQRRYDEAIEWAQKALALDSRHLLAREFLAGAYLFKDDFDRYLAEMIAHGAAHDVPAEQFEPLKIAYEAGGRSWFFRYCAEEMSKNPHLPAFQLAVFHAQAGDLDAAFYHLDRAILEHDPSLVDLGVAPQWDNLRADPRFAECVARIGLPPASGIAVTAGLLEGDPSGA